MRTLHSTALLSLCAFVAFGSACSRETPQAAAAPGTSMPTAAQVADTPPAQTPGDDITMQFVSGTSYAATGDRAEITLRVSGQRVGDVLERIAEVCGVTLEVSPDATLDLDRQVTMNFERISLRTAFMLMGDESGARIEGDDDAIRVQPVAPSAV